MGQITVDITGTLSRNRLTGIQRVVHGVLEASWELIDAVSYSAEDGGLYSVPNLPRLESKSQSMWARHLSGPVGWLWNFSAPIRAKMPFRGKLNAVARATYRAFLSPYQSEVAQRGIARSSDTIRSIWLLDVPDDRRHLQYLRFLVGNGVELCVYLYDLIPIKTEEVWSGDLNRDQSATFREYLELVLRAKTVLCLSKFTRDEYLAFSDGKSCQDQNVGVIYPPLQISSSNVVKRGQESVSPIGRTERRSTISILAVAPLLRRKNLRTVLLACEELVSQDGLAINFSLVCPASASIDIEAWHSLQRLKKMKNIQVMICRDISDSAMGELFRSADVLVSPSLYEGLGLPILEAVSAGVCVLASDIPVFRELREEISIRLVSTLSTTEWRKAIIEAVGYKCGVQDLGNLFPSNSVFFSELQRHNP